MIADDDAAAAAVAAAADAAAAAAVGVGEEEASGLSPWTSCPQSRYEAYYAQGKQEAAVPATGQKMLPSP